ncbi:MAG: translation initiation factor IF-3 [Armatimonadota bacterium]|nr:translation initiation factor IF-3 [Armatimonadota bacterium]MDR7518013.1 translation initiation factor IF-3 [Armatimonadota bacterium]MDR7550739.1 translation initiation factor IF-3 [Armatimonadota bacterium]
MARAVPFLLSRRTAQLLQAGRRRGIERETRINDRIRAREVRLIGPDGEQLGILPTREAIARAQEYGLDLVEVAPTANPPVCKIMDYGRYKYEQSKRDRDAHRKTRAGELKGMRMSPKIGEHDFQVKVRQVREFLQEGNKVRVAMWFRGREMAHPKVGEALLQRLAQEVAEVGGVEAMPRLEGRNMIMILTPRKG